MLLFFFFSSRRRHTRSDRDWSSDVCSSDLHAEGAVIEIGDGGIEIPLGAQRGAEGEIGDRHRGPSPSRRDATGPSLSHLRGRGTHLIPCLKAPRPLLREREGPAALAA